VTFRFQGIWVSFHEGQIMQCASELVAAKLIAEVERLQKIAG
jgi:hypothetical protein